MQSVITSPNPLAALPASLQQLISDLEGKSPTTPAQVRRIVLDANVQIEDIMPWSDFEHPGADSYGRKLVYQSDNFEVMVMSWVPGDFSTIHDHGYTQWGAVQVFGPAEHATFRMEDGMLSTLARWQFDSRDVVGVSHSLIHQMGNPTDANFLSLHVYGDVQEVQNVTGDARLFDLQRNKIQRIDGGVFFDLMEEEIKRTEEGPVGDFPTRLRHMVELIRRMRKAEAAPDRIEETYAEAFAASQRERLLGHLMPMLDEARHHTNSIQWRILNHELRTAATLQADMNAEVDEADAFQHYAALYDALIGQPSLEGFMAPYLKFVIEEYGLDLAQHTLLSVGCGTGMVEAHIQETFGMPADNMYGMDLSAAMVAEARKRIKADVGTVLELDPAIRQWSLVYSGLNVYQYLKPEELPVAIEKTAAVVKPGGYFIGDFVTPDYIRWYPHVMTSADERVISLRTPHLVEVEGRMYQESDITNVNFLHGHMHVTHAGKHRLFLPPLNRMRSYFEQAFGGKVMVYDAVSLTPVPEWADSCASARYLIVAQRA